VEWNLREIVAFRSDKTWVLNSPGEFQRTNREAESSKKHPESPKLRQLFFLPTNWLSPAPGLNSVATNDRRGGKHDGDNGCRRVKKPEQHGCSGFCQLVGFPGTQAQAGRMPLVTR
jgi:hypothetical protein